MGVKRPARALIPPDVAVDGLVADREEPLPPEVSRDLLGAPLPAEQLVYQREVFRREVAVTARAGAAAVSALLCREGAVVAVGAGTVTPDLAADRRAVATERARSATCCSLAFSARRAYTSPRG